MTPRSQALRKRPIGPPDQPPDEITNIWYDHRYFLAMKDGRGAICDMMEGQRRVARWVRMKAAERIPAKKMIHGNRRLEARIVRKDSLNKLRPHFAVCPIAVRKGQLFWAMIFGEIKLPMEGKS